MAVDARPEAQVLSASLVQEQVPAAQALAQWVLLAGELQAVQVSQPRVQ